RKRRAFDPHNLSNRIFIAKKSRGGGLADQCYFVAASNIIVGEVSAVRQRPGSDVHIICANPHDLRIQILAAGRKLDEVTDLRARPGDPGNLLANGLIILFGESSGAAEPSPKAAPSKIGRAHV